MCILCAFMCVPALCVCMTGVSEVLPRGAAEFVVKRGDGSGGSDPGLH